jgi:hypothetical protein
MTDTEYIAQLEVIIDDALELAAGYTDVDCVGDPPRFVPNKWMQWSINARATLGTPALEPSLLEHTTEILEAHRAGDCKGPRCPLHKRTDHHMRDWPQHWRGDRHIMERICPHGCGHPDPDDILAPDTVHGCDGCCKT